MHNWHLYLCFLAMSTDVLTACDAGTESPVQIHFTASDLIAEPALTDEQLAAMSPQDQARRLDPLRAIANAVGEAGRTVYADIYSSLTIDGNHALVQVYLTDPSKASRVMAVATQIDPTIDTSLLRFEKGAYTRHELTAASHRVLDLADANLLSYRVYRVSPTPDASGLTVIVNDVAEAQRTALNSGATLGALSLGDALGVKLSFRPGQPPEPKAWADVKWHDRTPFIGGDALTTSGHGHGCSAGIPAVRSSDNHPIMITAGHCFGVGAQIYTRGGRPGDYESGTLGNWVGKVTASFPNYHGDVFDSELIDGAGNNADESDTTDFKPLVGAAYSYNGDYVCHAGQRSFFMGRPTPCSIKVTNQDTFWTIAGHRVRGVYGYAMDAHGLPHGWGAAGGDSGATIFAILSGNNRQARGILSDGTPGDGTPGVSWTEATDIFNAYGLKLNPQQ